MNVSFYIPFTISFILLMNPAISARKRSFWSGTAIHYHFHIDENCRLVPLDFTSNPPVLVLTTSTFITCIFLKLFYWLSRHQVEFQIIYGSFYFVIVISCCFVVGFILTHISSYVNIIF